MPTNTVIIWQITKLTQTHTKVQAFSRRCELDSGRTRAKKTVIRMRSENTMWRRWRAREQSKKEKRKNARHKFLIKNINRLFPTLLWCLLFEFSVLSNIRMCFPAVAPRDVCMGGWCVCDEGDCDWEKNITVNQPARIISANYFVHYDFIKAYNFLLNRTPGEVHFSCFEKLTIRRIHLRSFMWRAFGIEPLGGWAGLPHPRD